MNNKEYFDKMEILSNRISNLDESINRRLKDQTDIINNLFDEINDIKQSQKTS